MRKVLFTICAIHTVVQLSKVSRRVCSDARYYTHSLTLYALRYSFKLSPMFPSASFAMASS